MSLRALMNERPAGSHTPPFRVVLVVEDEVLLRKVIARNLISRGIRVYEAGTASDAIRAASAEHPDLLLLDTNLPDQTGWEVLRELKRQGANIPSIVVAAVRVSQNRLEEFRPLAYLPKPFPIEALLRLVLGDANGTPGRDESLQED